MNYRFPEITHIDRVLPYLTGRDEFIVAERDYGKVINYVVQTSDTFRPIDPTDQFDPSPMLRECRGLVFYPDGRLMSRPFHKFFNLDEREETLQKNIDLSKPHVLLEKLDGSMIRPVWVEGNAGGIHGRHLRLGTKMGITDVALQAEEWMAGRQNYIDFVHEMHQAGATPIFEWLSLQNKVVIAHREERLVLTAVRFNDSGHYFSWTSLKNLAKEYGLDLVKAFESKGTPAELSEWIAGQSETEGYVLRFDDGHCVKIKTDWYVALHKLRDDLLSEKNVIALILDERMDDIRPKMDPEDRKVVELFEMNFENGIIRKLEELKAGYSNWRSLERKEFALKVAPTLNKLQRASVFAAWEDSSKLVPAYYDGLRRLTKTGTSCEENRDLWGGARYDRTAEVVE